MIEVIERHEDVRIVVARCGKTTIGMSEHAPETCLGSHGRNTRSVVYHTVLDEKLDNLLIEPVIDAIRIAMNEIDDLILGDQPLDGGNLVAVHLPSCARPATLMQAWYNCIMLPQPG